MKVNISLATVNDLEILSNLFLATEAKNVAINHNFFTNEKNIVLIAYADQVACGFLYAYILEGLYEIRPKMFLYSIDVLPNFQNKGFGSKLIERLKQVCHERNCSEMFVLTNDSNEIAKKTYERTGGLRENLDDVMYVYEFKRL